MTNNEPSKVNHNNRESHMRSIILVAAVILVAFFLAPKILGGRESRPVVGGANRASLDDAWQLTQTRCERVGEDFLLQGICTDVHRTD